MTAVNSTYEWNNFCVTNLVIAANIRTSSKNPLGFTDIENTNITPFVEGTSFLKPAFRTLEVINKSLTAVLKIYLNGSNDNIIYVLPNTTKTLTADDRVFYQYFEVKPSAALAAGDLIITGRR